MPEDDDIVNRINQALDGFDEKFVLHTMRLRERDCEYTARLRDWSPMDLTEAQRTLARQAVEQVHLQGYAIVPGFLDGERLHQIRTKMEPMFEGTRRITDRLGKTFSKGKQGPQTVHVANVLAKTDAIDDIVLDPLLLAIIKGVLGPHIQLNTGVAMCPDPGCAPQSLHRDEAFFQLYGHHDYGYPRMPVVANTLIALDDFTRSNGGTLLIPGSQTWAADRTPDMKDVVYNEMKAGSLAVFDGSLYHAGGGNTTLSERRRSLNLNFTRDWLRTQENHFLSISRERILAMPVGLQKLLGYKKSAGGLGGCDYQEPLKYLRRLVHHGEGSQALLAYDSVEDPRKARL